MRYPRFELLALGVGMVSILVGIAVTFRNGAVVEEIIAQCLLLVVLAGAVHRGKRGGLITAIIAIVAYTGLRVPLILRAGLTYDVAVLLLARSMTYAIMGIGGGILCSRVHHFLARFESVSNIDADSQLFNQRFVNSTVGSMVRQYERFHKPFSIVVLSSPEFASPNSKSGNLRALRAASSYLRENVRLIDDVARLDDGRIILIFPQTEKSGARIAASRIHRGLALLQPVDSDSICTEFLGADDDLRDIKALCGEPVSDTGAQADEACA